MMEMGIWRGYVLVPPDVVIDVTAGYRRGGVTASRFMLCL